MQSSLLLKLNFNAVKIPFTWIIRIIVGSVFIFSGFVKALDPWGSVYKFGEYFVALGIPQIPALIEVGVFLLFGIEFLIGISILLGCYRKSSPMGAFMFMCLMLPLTLWIAVSNPVADCGCFGDALILTNWQTFWKNVILFFLIIWLLRFNSSARCIITPALQWIMVVTSSIFIMIVGICGYKIQPMIDFRGFEVGKVLINESDDASPEYTFIYEKDGVKKEFQEDSVLPDEDSGWIFVDRIEKKSSQKSSQEESNFSIWDIDGNEDVTLEEIPDSGRVLLLMMPDLHDVSPAVTWKINALKSWADHNNVDMLAIVSGNKLDILEWEDLSLPSYPIYTADDTVIKEVVRGNPALVMLDNGIIKWKTSLNAIDDSDILEKSTALLEPDYGINLKSLLRNISGIYLAIMAFLIMFSLIHGGKVRHAKWSFPDKSVQ